MSGADGWTVTITGLSEGRLHAVMDRTDGASDAAPALVLAVDGRPMADAVPEQAGAGEIAVSAALPAQALGDGVTVLVLQDRATGAPLASYPVRAGGSVYVDLAAELALLRAEVAALKRAFMMDASTPKLRAVERALIVEEAAERALAAMKDGIAAAAEQSPAEADPARPTTGESL